MAATITDAGNGTSTTNGPTVATSANVVASVGDWIVVVAAASNDGTSGASSMFVTLAQPGISEGTKRDATIINYDPGAAGAGATLGIFSYEIIAAYNATVSLSFSPNTDQKAIQVYKVSPGAGEAISFVSSDTTGVTGNDTSYGAATVSVTSGDIIFGCAAIETDDTITGDADTTMGSWSTVITRLADGGADASTMSSVSQYKTTTGTGNQAWAATSSTARDSARTYIILRSAVSGVDAALAKTLGTLTSSAAFTVDTNTATLAKTLGAVTLSSSYTVDTNTAALTKTLGALTSSAAYTVDSLFSLTATLGAATSSAVYTVDALYSLSKTLGTLTGSAAFESVTTEVNYDLAKTLGTLTSSAAYSVDTNTAALSQTLGALTLSATFTSGASLDLAQTLGALTSTAVFTVDTNTAALAKTLAALSVSSAFSVDTNTAALAKTLAPLTLVAAFSTGALPADVTASRYQPILSVGRLMNR